MTRIALAAILAVILCGCKSTPMTIQDYNGMCRFGVSGDHGCGGSAGCSQFEAVISQSYADAEQCVAACDAQFRSMRGEASCASRVGKARSLCERFCRSNHP